MEILAHDGDEGGRIHGDDDDVRGRGQRLHEQQHVGLGGASDLL